jgi:uncharacterized protein (DUF697 family)
VSAALQNAAWVIPVSQSIHIIGMSVLFASALMINMRLLGVTRFGRPAAQLVRTLLPWMWTALGALLATGTVQTIAEPVRQFVTPAFWAKMSMIVVVVTMTAIFMHHLRRKAADGDGAAKRPSGTRLFAVLSTMLWVAIIICGRLIGYTSAFYQ